MCHFFFLT